MSRLTCVKKEPVLFEEFYLHPELFLGLDKVDLENRSLSRVVSDQYFLKPETGRQTFKISFLSGYKAKLLGLKSADPILEVQRTLNFPGAKGAVFSRLYCRTDRFAFSQTISLNMAR
jgi:GntR family transcriptional regulator